MTSTAGDRKYTITPALVDAVGRRETDDDIDTYIDRHGINGLSTALTYAVARECDEVTHRLTACDLATRSRDCPAGASAFGSRNFDAETSGASLSNIEGVDEGVDDG